MPRTMRLRRRSRPHTGNRLQVTLLPAIYKREQSSNKFVDGKIHCAAAARVPMEYVAITGILAGSVLVQTQV